MKLVDIKDSVYRCVGDSQCFGRGPYVPFKDGHETVDIWTCPTVDYYNFFSNSARAKAFYAREVIHGKMKLNKELADIFYACPDCGCCDTICPPIPHMYISRAMKAELFREGFAPKKCIELNTKMRDQQNLFGASNENRAKWSKDMNLPKEGEVLYFAGCYASFRQPNTAVGLVELMRKGGVNPAYLGREEWCCGLHAGFSGDIELEKTLAARNVKAIEQSGAKTLVVSCANCYRTFYTDYPAILGGELPFKVVHAVELLSDLMDSGKIHMKDLGKTRVTLHDPCHFGKQHIGRHHDLYGETRRVINAIPGAEFREMTYVRRWSACCGGGNSVTSTLTPEFTEYHSRKRCEEAKGVADIMLTPCVRCVENLSAANRKSKVGIEVRSLIEFVAERSE